MKNDKDKIIECIELYENINNIKSQKILCDEQKISYKTFRYHYTKHMTKKKNAIKERIEYDKVKVNEQNETVFVDINSEKIKLNLSGINDFVKENMEKMIHREFYFKTLEDENEHLLEYLGPFLKALRKEDPTSDYLKKIDNFDKIKKELQNKMK